MAMIGEDLSESVVKAKAALIGNYPEIDTKRLDEIIQKTQKAAQYLKGQAPTAPAPISTLPPGYSENEETSVVQAMAAQRAYRDGVEKYKEIHTNAYKAVSSGASIQPDATDEQVLSILSKDTLDKVIDDSVNVSKEKGTQYFNDPTTRAELKRGLIQSVFNQAGVINPETIDLPDRK